VTHVRLEGSAQPVCLAEQVLAHLS
jgi:hypothetical protein